MFYRKFLKNTGRFLGRPLDVLERFLKNTGGFRSFRAFLWLRFEIEVSAIHIDYFEPRAQSQLVLAKFVFPSTGATNRFALRKKRMPCGQEFYGL